MKLPFVTPIVRNVLRVLSFLLFAVTAFSAYGGRFDPDFFTFPGVMVLCLPYLAITTLIVSLIWIFCMRFITGGIGILTLIICASPVTTASPLHLSKNPTPDARQFTVLTYNILHGRDQQQKDGQQGNRAFEYVINSGADIVCLQEVMRWQEEEIPNYESFRDTLFKLYPYHAFVEGRDTKVLSKYPMRTLDAETLIGSPDFDRNRYTFYEININGRKLALVNMHMRSPMLSEEERNVVKEMKTIRGAKESMSEMKGSIREKMSVSMKKRKVDVENLRQAIARIDLPLIVCGDFNDVPESYAYRLLRGEDLHDAYVETGFGPMITFNQHMFWLHLDQIFYRGPLRALSVKKGTLKASDHYPLIAEFEFTGSAR